MNSVDRFFVGSFFLLTIWGLYLALKHLEIISLILSGGCQ